MKKTVVMKRAIAAAVAWLLLLVPCAVLGACGETVAVDSIEIVEPASAVKAGDVFTLTYRTVPEDAADKIDVDWEIGDERRLSHKGDEFTALTCGTVKVTARVKGGEATDEITLKVAAPEGYREYSAKGYCVVYPSDWTPSKLGAVQTWTAPNGTTNMNVATETLNKTYFSAPAASFQTLIESTYGLLGYTVQFTRPVTVKKEKYLGVDRVRVEYSYSLTLQGVTSNLCQSQLIFNNEEANLSCVLTVTYRAEEDEEEISKIKDVVFNQYLPA